MNRTARAWLLTLIPGGAVVAVYLAFAALLVSAVWVTPDPIRPISGLPRRDRAAVVLETIGALSVPIAGAVAIAARRARWYRTARVAALFGLIVAGVVGVRLVGRRREAARAPHVLVLTLDGFWAERMASYGAARAPTPFLDRLARQSLVGLNFYPQSCCTTSGLLTLVTGRHPIELRTLYPPQRLALSDQSRGLPTLLGSRGFRTISFTEKYYSDMQDLGVMGFDRINGWQRPATWIDKVPPWLRSHAWAVDAALGALALDVVEVDPPFRVSGGPHSAPNKLATLLGELDGARQPIFAHLHLLESHGPRFDIARPVFSKDKTDIRDWDLDAYDDALRELDENLADFFYQLGVRGLLDDVIVVITSDHGLTWNPAQRIPLLVYGRGVTPGWIQENTQPIDVAPTILRLLGQPWPAWMAGRSLTNRGSLDARRIIISSEVRGQEPDVDTKRWQLPSWTPNHGLGRVSAILCDRRYELDLQSGAMTIMPMTGKLATCPPGTVAQPAQLQKALLEYLQQFDYHPLQPPYLAN